MIFCIWMMKKIIATEFDLKLNSFKGLNKKVVNESTNSKDINFYKKTIVSEKNIDLFIDFIKDINLYNSKIKNIKFNNSRNLDSPN